MRKLVRDLAAPFAAVRGKPVAGIDRQKYEWLPRLGEHLEIPLPRSFG